MKNQELFDRTVGILVKAYFNGTLEATDCAKCAVGNLVANGMGYTLTNNYNEWKSKDDCIIDPAWYDLRYGDYSIEGKIEIESTGYSIKDFLKIEKIFMNNSNPYCGGSNYLGLMSVVDTLMLIHEATPQEAQSAKELFTLADVG